MSLAVLLIQRASERSVGQAGERRHGIGEHERDCGDRKRSVRHGRGIDRSVMQDSLEGLRGTEQILTRRIEALAALPQRALLLGVDFMDTDPEDALGLAGPELHRRA